jgi:hypothetical protein
MLDFEQKQRIYVLHSLKFPFFLIQIIYLAHQTNFVIGSNGQKVFVQIAVQLENLLKFKAQLKNAFREVRQIKQGKKFGTPLSTLINDFT